MSYTYLCERRNTMCSVSVFLWFFVWTPVTIRGIIGWQNDSSSHCTALHCTAHDRTALKYTVFHCCTLHYTAIPFTALQYTSLYCNTLNCTSIHCTLLQYTEQDCNTLICTAIHCTAIHCTTQRCTGSWSLFVTKSREFPDNYWVTPHIRSHQTNNRKIIKKYHHLCRKHFSIYLIFLLGLGSLHITTLWHKGSKVLMVLQLV